MLTHVHGETPEQARFRTGLTSREERKSILAEYEAMERKPVFTPWQVAVSEALRDGEAEKAIEAWRLRGRLHLCHDEEKTLTRLVEDWERHVKQEPGTSTVVLARTKAEGRALSWLMRERVLAHTPDAKRAVIEVSRDLDGRLTEAAGGRGGRSHPHRRDPVGRSSSSTGPWSPSRTWRSGARKPPRYRAKARNGEAAGRGVVGGHRSFRAGVLRSHHGAHR